MTDDKFMELFNERCHDVRKWMKPIQCSPRTIARLRRISVAAKCPFGQDHTNPDRFVIIAGWTLKDFKDPEKRIFLVRNRKLKGDSFIIEQTQ